MKYIIFVFLMALINVPFLDESLNAASFGFCIGICFMMVLNYYFNNHAGGGRD